MGSGPARTHPLGGPRSATSRGTSLEALQAQPIERCSGARPEPAICLLSLLLASLVVWPGLALAEPTNAATGSLQTLSLPQALEYAALHQPSLRAAEARAQAALADAAVPWAQWFPRAGATIQFLEGTANNTTGSYLGSAYVDIPRIGGTRFTVPSTATWAPSASTLIGIGARQELFDFGKIAAQAAIYDATAESVKYRAEVEALNLQLAVKESYFAVLAAKAILATAEAGYQRSHEQRDFASAGVHSGLRNPIDLTRAEADLMRLDASRIRARGSLAAAQGVFAAVVGSTAPLLDVAAEPPTPPAPPALSGVLERAAQQDPEILQYQARLRAQQARSRSTLMELLPDFSLSGTLSGRTGGAAPSTGAADGIGLVPDVPNWDLGLAVSWQIFDLGILARRTASLRYEKAAAADLETVRLNTDSAITQVYTATDVALQALPALQRSVEAATANYAQADARFRAGLGTSVELADAEAVRIDSEIQQALGQFEYQRARARLARAIAEAP